MSPNSATLTVVRAEPAHKTDKSKKDPAASASGHKSDAQRNERCFESFHVGGQVVCDGIVTKPPPASGTTPPV